MIGQQVANNKAAAENRIVDRAGNADQARMSRQCRRQIDGEIQFWLYL